MTINDICLWTGRAAILSAIAWLAWHPLAVIYLAARDTYTSIRNAIDSPPKQWWRWLYLPSVFVSDLWRQTEARWHGYQTYTIREKKKP